MKFAEKHTFKQLATYRQPKVLTNGIRLSARAAGPRLGRAAVRSLLLWRSVVNRVSRTSAAALEGVIETSPVPDFVRERASLVVGRNAVVGHGTMEEDNTIFLWSCGVVAREGGVAEEALTFALHEPGRSLSKISNKLGKDAHPTVQILREDASPMRNISFISSSSSLQAVHQ